MADVSDPQITREEFDRLESKVDQLLGLAPTIDALGAVLVRQNVATTRAGLSKNTLSQNEKISKFEEFGHRRTFIEIGDIAVVQRRPRKRKKR